MNTEVLVPASGLGLAAPVPYVIQSCVLAPPAPPPGPDPENAIYAPVPPGITLDSLPVLDTVTQLIDTSPDQIIGCANDLPAGGEQQTLDALFPAAIDGDGVVNRTNNDIWVYDGTTWNNVGPTPGPQVVVTSVLPPWNEILTYEARVRTRLLAQSLAYALQLLTEPDPFSITLGFSVAATRLVKIPSSEFTLSAELPTYENPYAAVTSVEPTLYTGTGATQTITGLPWRPGIVWFKSRSAIGIHALVDDLRDATRYWQPHTTTAELNSALLCQSIDSNGFTLGSTGGVNDLDTTYVAWPFAPISAPTTNTDGTITTTVAKSSFYSVFTYTGTGVAGSTLGHGLDVAPDFVIIKCRSQAIVAVAGGPIVGDDNRMFLNSAAARGASTANVRSTNSSTILVGADSGVNLSARTYVAYAFHNLRGVCKAGTYVGDGETAGKEIVCGFAVKFLIVKRRDGGNGDWNIIDSARDLETNRLLITTAAETTVSAFYELTATGFIAKRGNQQTDHDLNISGSTYMFIAFGAYVPTTIAPTTALTVDAEPPTVTVN